MLRDKPKLKYNGLTVVLSNPSRFDKHSLLTANGGVFFNNQCLRPECNVMQVDVRLMEDKSPWLEGTKCILLLGEAALHEYCKDTLDNTLNEMRGSPLLVDGISAIATYLPQDAAEISGKNYEKQYNPLAGDYEGDEDDEDYNKDTNEDEGDVKAHSSTARRNYGFWLKADVRKCKAILANGGVIPRERYSPLYKTYPSADEVINILTGTKGKFLYFDIETDYEEQNLLCFSFSFGAGEGAQVTTWNVPVLDNNYQLSYSSFYFILRALAVAFRDNIVVAHNGAAFDAFVMAIKYHIPIVRMYDTMLAQHRCYPDVEKSLGHATSLWTWQRFHKDTDSQAYVTREHMTQKLKYCGTDVFTMFLIHQAIEAHTVKVPGLRESIDCVMASIRPYLTCTIQGIKYSPEKVKVVMNENDRLMMQYIRMIKLLIGESGMAACKAAVKGKAKAFPGSNKQCVSYFHKQLGYPEVFKTPSGESSLGAKAMYTLALKHPDNPVITLVLLYRGVAKESGSLKFNPFKDDNNKILPRNKPSEDGIQTNGGSISKSIYALANR